MTRYVLSTAQTRALSHPGPCRQCLLDVFSVVRWRDLSREARARFVRRRMELKRSRDELPEGAADDIPF